MSTKINMKTRWKSSRIEGDKSFATVLNYAIETAKDHDTLVFPSGEFWLNKPIYSDKVVHWEGAGDTVLRPMDWQGPCFHFTRKYSIPTVRINNLTFFAAHYNRENDKHDCMLINTRVKMKDCNIYNFRGKGIELNGNSGLETDASFSYFESVLISYCLNKGVHIHGGDNNQIVFVHLDVRDTQGEGIGVSDEGFLGCQLVCCMGHSNPGGHYRATDPNCRTTLVACYGEGDSKPNYLYGQSTAIGGFLANSVEGGLWEGWSQSAWVRGRAHSHINVNLFQLDEKNHLRLGSSHGYNSSQLAFHPMPVESSGPWSHWRFQHEGLNDVMHMFGGTTAYPAKFYGRDLQMASAGFPHMMVGRRLLMYGNPTALAKSYLYDMIMLEVGDIIYNDGFNGTNNERWVCIKAGSWKDAVFTERN